MDIKTFSTGPFQTNVYLLACSETKELAIIDPAPESCSPVIEYIQKQGYTPTKILLTHSHFDHIGDLERLKQYFKIPVYVHSLDKPNVESPGADGIPFFLDIPPSTVEEELHDHDQISVGNLHLEVIHTPGHTPGGVSFYLKEHGILFSGDTLFAGSIGNLALPTSDSEAMYASLLKLAKLPSKTKVYPGHGESTSIGSEKWLKQPESLFPVLKN